MNKKDHVDLFKAYENYLSAFNDNDIQTINDCVQYPLAYIGTGAVSLLDNFPLSPVDMKAGIGWDESEAFEIDIVAVGKNKAHLLMENSRQLRNGLVPLLWREPHSFRLPLFHNT
jgi:hypothetical protein